MKLYLQAPLEKYQTPPKLSLTAFYKPQYEIKQTEVLSYLLIIMRMKAPMTIMITWAKSVQITAVRPPRTGTDSMVNKINKLCIV